MRGGQGRQQKPRAGRRHSAISLCWGPDCCGHPVDADVLRSRSDGGVESSFVQALLNTHPHAHARASTPMKDDTALEERGLHATPSPWTATGDPGLPQPSTECSENHHRQGQATLDTHARACTHARAHTHTHARARTHARACALPQASCSQVICCHIVMSLFEVVRSCQSYVCAFGPWPLCSCSCSQGRQTCCARAVKSRPQAVSVRSGCLIMHFGSRTCFNRCIFQEPPLYNSLWPAVDVHLVPKACCTCLHGWGVCAHVFLTS